jgi:H+/Cl- antiporter ClcA
LDDFATFTHSGLMFPLVVLMIATIGIVGGCYGIFLPQKRIEANRRMRWLGSDPATVKAIGYFEVIVGAIVLGLSAYFFLRLP